MANENYQNNPEKKQVKLVDPTAWLREGMAEVTYFLKLAWEDYNPATIGRLKFAAKQAIDGRDSFTEEERKIVSELYGNVHYAEYVSSGKVFEDFYSVLEDIQKGVGREEEEDYAPYVDRMLNTQLMESGIKEAVSIAEEAHKRKSKGALEALFGELDSFFRLDGER